MAKWYVVLFLVFGGVLLYVFLQDPCGNNLIQDFASRHPGYELLQHGPSEQPMEGVHCYVQYRKPDSPEVYEDVWRYEQTADGWRFARILENHEKTN